MHDDMYIIVQALSNWLYYNAVPGFWSWSHRVNLIFLFFNYFSIYCPYSPFCCLKNYQTKVTIPKQPFTNVDKVINPANSPQKSYFYLIITICYYSMSIIICNLQLLTSFATDNIQEFSSLATEDDTSIL